MKEQLISVTEKDNVLSRINSDKAHEKHLLHRAVHIFLVDKKGRLFCRLRSLKKKIYPGYWSTSVGSHVPFGETYDLTAHRALKNTLGVDCPLIFIGKARVQDKIENEISATYIGYIGYSKEKLRFNPQQIEGGKFLTIDQIKKLTRQKNVTPHLGHSLELYREYKKRH